METKVCKICGKELPLNEFGVNNRFKDGHANKCKACAKKMRGNISEGITQQGIKATFKISDFTDDMLFAELRRRGFTGELRYSKVVSV